jgi:RNA-directed DNA polymerase
VVDADIAAAFDNIDQPALLAAIGPAPGRELIKQWLRAGYLDAGQFHETLTGTPQGSVISLLLLNVALHGMEEALGISYDAQGKLCGRRAVVRYADDLVAFCESREDAEAVVQLLNAWLGKRGLTLSGEKTRIVHLREGFDFLGFNIRHYPAPQTSRTGYKLLIKPSKQSVTKMRQKLRDAWLRLRGSNVQTVIRQLNPIIRGWANYFRTGVASETFHQLDEWLYYRQRRYVSRQHPRKSHAWQKHQYWGKLNPQRADHWVFGDKQTGAYLLKFSWFKIERHIIVRGKASPDDPQLREYWATRQQQGVKNTPPRVQRLARKQNYVCRLCGETLFNDEELHVHHIEPTGKQGSDDEGNQTLVHLYCHQQIHSGKIRPTDASGEVLLV